MKTMKKSVIIVISSIFAAVSFTACTADDNIVEQTPTFTNNNIENPVSDAKVTASGIVRAETKKNFTRGNAGELNPEDIIIRQVSESEAKMMLQNGGGKSTFYMYQWVTLNYRCNTADGTQKDLSELVVWPYRNYGFVETNPAAEQLVIGCHSTITSNAQCPSNFSNMSSLGEINMLALFAHAWSQNALVVVPDYEGYGSTASIPHPYCNRELTAEQVVTGVKAGLSYYESNVTKMDPNWSGVAIGYSQGGAVAAGVLRYCQEHNETSLRLKGAVCGDGPYDPLATLKRYIAMDKLYMPVAPTLLLKGAVDTDPDMMALGCKYEDFVTDKFFQTGIFDMIRDKQATTDDIQAALLNHSFEYGDEGGFTMRAQSNDGFLPYTKSNATDSKGKKRTFELENGKGYNYCTVDQCLKPEVIEYFRNGTISGDVPEAKLKALEKAMAKNALTAGGFTPGNGFTFFHSIGDEVVPYCNFESVRNTWGVNSITALSYQSETTLHVATGTAFFLDYCGNLVNEILKGEWAPREETVGGHFWKDGSKKLGVRV
jgi:pimeloyl-ACP methyl ester carboxylesterase